MPSPTRSRPASLRPALVALHAVDAGARTSRASWLGEGWGSTAYRVESASGDWVLRLPRPRSYWAMEDLEREARLLPLLQRRPFEVGVPRDARILVDASGQALGAIHRMVPGTPLGEAGHPRGHARAELLAAIGRALSVLHATPKGAAKRHGAREIDLWTEHYAGYIAQARPHLPPAARAWLTAKAKRFERRGGTTSAPRVLVHGDLSGDHLLVDRTGRLSGLIDFADARLADPALDFAGILNELGWRDLHRILDHYDGELDEGALYRTRFYIEVAPIYQVVDGAVAVGSSLRRTGIRRLSARAGRPR